jgi:hypothetical protein
MRLVRTAASRQGGNRRARLTPLERQPPVAIRAPPAEGTIEHG